MHRSSVPVLVCQMFSRTVRQTMTASPDPPEPTVYKVAQVLEVAASCHDVSDHDVVAADRTFFGTQYTCCNRVFESFRITNSYKPFTDLSTVGISPTTITRSD